MKKKLIFTFGAVLISAGFLFILELPNTTFAAGCDVKNVYFSPSFGEINPNTWFNRGDRPTFTVKIIGNGSCGGQTINAYLASVGYFTLFKTYDTAWSSNAANTLTFDQGSNEIELTFKAGEDKCSAIKGFNDCSLQFRIKTPATGSWFISRDVSGSKGLLEYECDERFGTCDGSIKFEFLGIRGGKAGGVSLSNTICAYIAENGVYACIHNSNQKAVEGKCSEVSECAGHDCKSIDDKLCGQRAYNYGCVVFDTQKNTNIYACSHANKSDCSDASSCAGKQCFKVEPANLCGNPVPAGGPGVPPPGGGPGVGVPQTYVFNLKNPIEAENFQDLVNIIGRWIFNLAIPIAVIMIIWAGVLMLTAGGDPGRFKKGAKALWYAVIGLAIVLIGKGFVTLIQSILSLRNR